MPNAIASRVPLVDLTNGLITTQWYRYILSLASGTVMTATATLDFPNTSAQSSSDLTISVPGAVDGDVVTLGVPNACMLANSCYTGWVSAPDTVTVRFNNYSSGAQNPASGTFRAVVTRY